MRLLLFIGGLSYSAPLITPSKYKEKRFIIISVAIEKPYLSIPDQIACLKSQGLVFGDEAKAKRILKTHSYYSIVNGYCDLLVASKSPRRFRPNSTFEELLAIHDFDTSFRRFLFPQILYVEEKIKAAVIDGYAKQTNPDGTFKHTKDDYLCLTSYETFTPTKSKAATKLIIELGKIVTANAEKERAFKYAFDNYGYIPLWVLATKMTFGQISRFYECVDVQIRSGVSQIFKLSEGEMRTALKIVNLVRNCCAHNNRVFCSYVVPVIPSSLGSGSKMVTVDINCSQKFGSLLYCLEFMLSSVKFKKIIKELSKELSSLKSKLTTIPISAILRRMGISANMVSQFGIVIV